MLRGALLAFTRGRKVPRTGYTVLTPKRGPRDYYKGKGAQPTGKHTRKGAAHQPLQAVSQPGSGETRPTAGLCATMSRGHAMAVMGMQQLWL